MILMLAFVRSKVVVLETYQNKRFHPQKLLINCIDTKFLHFNFVLLYLSNCYFIELLVILSNH